MMHVVSSSHFILPRREKIQEKYEFADKATRLSTLVFKPSLFTSDGWEHWSVSSVAFANYRSKHAGR